MTSHHRTIRPTLVLALALAALAAAGCAEGTAPATPAADGEAGLRVINATQQPVDLLVDGTLVASAVGVATVSPRVAVSAGLHTVQLRGRNGATASLPALTTAGATLTAVATAASKSASPSLEAAVLVDTGGIVPAGRSKMRLAHLAQGAPLVESWRTQPDFGTPTHVVMPFRFGEVTPYLQSDAGAWEVWVTAAGSTAKLATTGAFTIPSGERRTVALLDSAGVLRMRVIAE